MLWQMRAKVGSLARDINQFAVAAIFAGLFASLPLWGNEPDEAKNDEEIDCEEKTEEIEVCGRKETISRMCAFPFVTDAMAAEATKYPILKTEHERHNFCISTEPDCKALESEKGDEKLKEEIEADQGGDIPSKIRFHLSVTGRTVDKKFLGVRNDAALVTTKGFTRDFQAGHQLFRIVGYKKFHEDAEGVALVNRGVVDKEIDELNNLAQALSEMKQKFQKEEDEISRKNTEDYEVIARNSALELSAVSCELKKMAEKNRRIENRISKVIVDGELTKGKYGQGSPSSPYPESHSEITGVKSDERLPSSSAPSQAQPALEKARIPLSPVESGGGLLSMSGASSPFFGPASDASQDIILAAFGSDPDLVTQQVREIASAPSGMSEVDDPLFVRVHRQYRTRDKLGVFRQSLVD